MFRSRDEEAGATASEYALIASLIALVVIASVTQFGLAVVQLFGIPCGVFIPC